MIETYLSHLNEVNGWCTEEKARAMIEAALNCRPMLAVEIGVFAGRSFFAVALAMEYLGQGLAFGIEPWNPEPCAKGMPNTDPNAKWWSGIDHGKIEHECRQRQAQLGLEHRCLLFKGTSEQARVDLEIVRRVLGRPPIDFLHIDGNHSEECSKSDVQSYMPLVRSGGDVWFDDTDWESTKTAQGLLRESCDLIQSWKTFARYRRR